MNQNLGPQFEYQGSHRPAEPDDGVGAPFHEADKVMPDVTGPRGDRLYGFHGPDVDGESFSQMRAAKSRPDAPVKIYRAVPKAEHGINRGDWVTTSRRYAEQHAAQDENPKNDWPIVEGTARASEVWGHGDDPNEWGYWPSGS